MRFLRNRISKPEAASLLAKNGVDQLTNTTNKLNRMAEHFSDVLNCDNPVDDVILQQIPQMPVTPDTDSLAEPLSAA